MVIKYLQQRIAGFLAERPRTYPELWEYLRSMGLANEPKVHEALAGLISRRIIGVSGGIYSRYPRSSYEPGEIQAMAPESDPAFS